MVDTSGIAAPISAGGKCAKTRARNELNVCFVGRKSQSKMAHFGLGFEGFASHQIRHSEAIFQVHILIRASSLWR